MKMIQQIVIILSILTWQLSLYSIETVLSLDYSLRTLSQEAYTLQVSQFPHLIKIIDSSFNSLGPQLNNLQSLKPTIDLMQLVVVWQDLTVESFIGTMLDAFCAAMAIGSGYETQEQQNALLTFMHSTNNYLLETVREDLKIGENFKKKPLSIGGGSASCGYHAIVHTKTLYDALQTTQLAQRDKLLSRLTNALYINMQFCESSLRSLLLPDKTKTLRDFIIEKNAGSQRFSDANGEWLTDEGILLIAEKVFGTSSKIDALKISESASTKVLESILLYEGHSRPLEKTMHILEKRGLSVWLVFDRSHWYGVLVNHQGIVPQCIIVDSKNKPRYASKALQSILEDEMPSRFGALNDQLQTTLAPQQNSEVSKRAQRHANLMVLAPLHDTEAVIEGLAALEQPLTPTDVLIIAHEYQAYPDIALKNANGLLTKFIDILKKSKYLKDRIIAILSEQLNDKETPEVIALINQLVPS